jgi:hypothetical protein
VFLSPASRGTPSLGDGHAAAEREANPCRGIFQEKQKREILIVSPTGGISTQGESVEVHQEGVPLQRLLVLMLMGFPFMTRVRMVMAAVFLAGGMAVIVIRSLGVRMIMAVLMAVLM